MYRAIIAASALVLVSAPAYAQDEDRYVLERTDQGFVRMDRRSGEMSACTEDGARLVCKLAADERTAYQDEIDRLQASVEALAARIERLENSPTARLESQLPSQEEFSRTMSYMEQFLRRFMGVVKDIEKDAGDAPDRT